MSKEGERMRACFVVQKRFLAIISLNQYKMIQAHSVLCIRGGAAATFVRY